MKKRTSRKRTAPNPGAQLDATEKQLLAAEELKDAAVKAYDELRAHLGRHRCDCGAHHFPASMALHAALRSDKKCKRCGTTYESHWSSCMKCVNPAAPAKERCKPCQDGDHSWCPKREIPTGLCCCRSVPKAEEKCSRCRKKIHDPSIPCTTAAYIRGDYDRRRVTAMAWRGVLHPKGYKGCKYRRPAPKAEERCSQPTEWKHNGGFNEATAWCRKPACGTIFIGYEGDDDKGGEQEPRCPEHGGPAPAAKKERKRCDSHNGDIRCKKCAELNCPDPEPAAEERCPQCKHTGPHDHYLDEKRAGFGQCRWCECIRRSPPALRASGDVRSYAGKECIHPHSEHRNRCACPCEKCLALFPGPQGGHPKWTCPHSVVKDGVCWSCGKRRPAQGPRPRIPVPTKTERCRCYYRLDFGMPHMAWCHCKCHAAEKIAELSAEYNKEFDRRINAEALLEIERMGPCRFGKDGMPLPMNHLSEHCPVCWQAEKCSQGNPAHEGVTDCVHCGNDMDLTCCVACCPTRPAPVKCEHEKRMPYAEGTGFWCTVCGADNIGPGKVQK